MKIYLTLFISLFCFISFAQNNSNYMDKPMKSLEVLQGFEFKKHEITITVRSGGCTRKEDFRIEHNLVGDFVMVSFYRIKADLCRAMIDDFTITYTLEELRLTTENPIVLNNAFYPASLDRK